MSLLAFVSNFYKSPNRFIRLFLCSYCPWCLHFQIPTLDQSLRLAACTPQYQSQPCHQQIINQSTTNDPMNTHNSTNTHTHHLIPHLKTYTPITFNRWFYPLEKKSAEFVTWSNAYIFVYMMNIWVIHNIFCLI